MKSPKLTVNERKVLSVLGKDKRMYFEDIVKNTKLSVKEVTHTIDKLTKKGFVGDVAMDRFSLKDFKGHTLEQKQLHIMLKISNELYNLYSEISQIKAYLIYDKKD